MDKKASTIYEILSQIMASNELIYTIFISDTEATNTGTKNNVITRLRGD